MFFSAPESTTSNSEEVFNDDEEMNSEEVSNDDEEMKKIKSIYNYLKCGKRNFIF